MHKTIDQKLKHESIETKIHWNMNLILKQGSIIDTSANYWNNNPLKHESIGFNGRTREVHKGSGSETRIHWNNSHLLKQGSIIETQEIETTRNYWNKLTLKQGSIIEMHKPIDQLYETWIHWNNTSTIETKNQLNQE